VVLLLFAPARCHPLKFRVLARNLWKSRKEILSELGKSYVTAFCHVLNLCHHTVGMFSSPKFAVAQNWPSFLLRPKFPYPFRRLLADIPTTVHKTKSLFVFFIQLRLLIFEISSLNIQLLKREVIPATRLRRARPTRTSHTWSPNFSSSAMKIKILLPKNYVQQHVVYIRNGNSFVFFHPQGLRIFASTLSDFRRPIHLTWIIDSSFACIWCYSLCTSDVPYCTDVIDIHIVFAFLTVLWIMISPSVWLKSGHSTVDGLLWRTKTFIQAWASSKFMFQNLLEFSKCS
jgi:hypothetical protein